MAIEQHEFRLADDRVAIDAYGASQHHDDGGVPFGEG
jgi:hypothetical protein